MTQLDANTAREYQLPELNDLPVAATTTIYEGSAVGDNGSGYARQLNAGDPFRGFALRKADNDPGAAGDIDVHVRQKGRIVLPISGLAITDVGKPVYASDGNAFTLTASTNTHIGRVIGWVSTGYGVVEFDASRGGAGVLTPLTDNTAGTANDTLQALADGSTYANDVAAIRNNFADLAAKVNALIAMQK